MLREIDLKLRLMFSYIYRGIIVLYSFSLLYFDAGNYFNWSLYLVGYIIYFSIFLYLIKVKKWNTSMVRLILDFLFIYFVLYGKNIENSSVYFLLLLPIINSQNNSSDDINTINLCKRYYVYPFCAFGIFFISSFHFQLILFFPLIVLIFIDQFLKLRSSIDSVHSVIFKLIDEFYTKNYGRKELTLIYEELISKINTTPYTRNLKVKSISCFVLTDKKKLLLVNSSIQIFTFKFNYMDNLIKSINEERIVFDFSLEINGKKNEKGLLTLIKGTDLKYVFLILVDNKVSPFHRFITPRIILLPILKHLAKIYQTQFHLSSYKVDFLNKLKNKSEYVLKSLEVMHFVKGSLSPIKGALTTSKMYDDETDEVKKDFLLQKYHNQRKIALDEINNIIERAKFILEKSENPYIVSSAKDHSFYELLTFTRRRWYDIFGELENELIINESDLNYEEIECQYDTDYLHIIFTDIMGNMKNNSSGLNSLTFNIKNDFISISIGNSVNISTYDYIELKKAVDSYNLNDRWEINKRKSHGLTNIKLYLKQMSIENAITLSNNEFIFTLKFPLKK